MRKLLPKNYNEKEFDSLTNEKSKIKDDIVNIKLSDGIATAKIISVRNEDKKNEKK